MDDRLERNKRQVMAFYDLMFKQCRPADGKIVEHWDVLQVVPAQAGHGNTMF